jgi:uncharacterized membrane protein
MQAAVGLAQDLWERMQLFPHASMSYQLQLGQVAPNTDCKSQACTPSQWAQSDLSAWQAAVQLRLPGAKTQLVTNASAKVQLLLAWPGSSTADPCHCANCLPKPPPLLANQLVFMKRCLRTSQHGHTLVESLAGMVLSLWVIMAAFAAFAWVQSNHQHMQARADMQERLHTALSLLQERVARAGAPALQFDAQNKAELLSPTFSVQGVGSTLSLMHHSSLSPSDCQGHQASTLAWIQDEFKRSTRNELSCKDSFRSNTNYQALVDNIDQVGFLYAEILPGAEPRMQWRNANAVANWQGVRGVQTCLQTKLPGLGALPASSSCSSGQPLNSPSLSWQGVAFLRHAKP